MAYPQLTDHAGASEVASRIASGATTPVEVVERTIARIEKDDVHINAVIVVNNNSALNQEIRLNDTAYGGQQRGRSEEMWRFPDIDFAKVAESFGCVGLRVDRPQDLDETLRNAMSMDKPVVVDVVTDTYAIAPHPWTATGRDFHSYQKTGA